MQQAVRVRLRKSNRISVCLAKDLTLSRGDACIVRTERGLEYGTCVCPPQDIPDDAQRLPTLTIVRKANATDESTYRQLFIEEEKSKTICLERIRNRNMPMQLVDVEYTFDRHKAVFYFTADDRVDFRELVRDLAHDLKMRIELRHIQVRDKAKIVGGLSACGRELCCATWLGEFMPISMKMAKRQNLSLNPTKISGQCGRLMCCLSYENDQYDKKKKTLITDAREAAPATAWDNAGDEVPEEEIALLRDGDTHVSAIVVSEPTESIYEAGPEDVGEIAPHAESETSYEDHHEDDAEDGDDAMAESSQPEGNAGEVSSNRSRRGRRRPRRRRRRHKSGDAGTHPPAPRQD